MQERAVLVVLLGFFVSIAAAQEKPVGRKPVRVAAVTLSWVGKDRTLPHVLGMLDRAATERAEIVCLPEDCVPTDGGPSARAALETIAKATAGHKFFVAVPLAEKDRGKVYSTSYLVGPDGKVIGKYRKSHPRPDERDLP